MCNETGPCGNGEFRDLVLDLACEVEGMYAPVMKSVSEANLYHWRSRDEDSRLNTLYYGLQTAHALTWFMIGELYGDNSMSFDERNRIISEELRECVVGNDDSLNFAITAELPSLLVRVSSIVARLDERMQVDVCGDPKFSRYYSGLRVTKELVEAVVKKVNGQSVGIEGESGSCDCLEAALQQVEAYISGVDRTVIAPDVLCEFACL